MKEKRHEREFEFGDGVIGGAGGSFGGEGDSGGGWARSFRQVGGGDGHPVQTGGEVKPWPAGPRAVFAVEVRPEAGQSAYCTSALHGTAFQAV